METMDMSLIQLIDSRRKASFPHQNVQLILYQVLAGLAHIHKSGFFHRDIKPENVLVLKVPVPPSQLFNLARKQEQQQQSTLGSFYQFNDSALKGSSYSIDSLSSYQTSLTSSSTSLSSAQFSLLDDQPDLETENESYIVKLADFGLARNIDCPDPYTSYVSTRWYRAPELLLRKGSYSCPIDVWAFGTMATEISTLKPLFPGANEQDQLYRQISILGYPGPKSHGGPWRSLSLLARKQRTVLPKTEV